MKDYHKVTKGRISKLAGNIIENRYVCEKNSATGRKVFFPRVFNPGKNNFVVIRKYALKTAGQAIQKSQEIQERIFNIYKTREAV